MTEATKRSARSAGWVLFGAVGLSLTSAVVFGAMSRTYVLDFLSLWPLLTPLLWLAFKHHPAIPAYAASVLVFVAGLHFSAWEPLPSSVGDTSERGVAEAGSFEVALPAGRLVLGSASEGTLYLVRPIRSGGLVGPPALVRTDGYLQVVGIARPGGFWYRYGGWALSLSPETVWDIGLVAETLDLDLSHLNIVRGAFTGTGEIRLGAGGAGDLQLDGRIRVTVPEGVGVDLEGQADVPDSWTATPTGFSAGKDPTYHIVVVPGSVVEVFEGTLP